MSTGMQYMHYNHSKMQGSSGWYLWIYDYQVRFIAQYIYNIPLSLPLLPLNEHFVLHIQNFGLKFLCYFPSVMFLRVPYGENHLYWKHCDKCTIAYNCCLGTKRLPLYLPKIIAADIISTNTAQQQSINPYTVCLFGGFCYVVRYWCCSNNAYREWGVGICGVTPVSSWINVY